MSHPISGRYLSRSALLAGAALFGLLLTGCGSSTPGTATAATTSSTAAASTAASDPADLPAGAASGDPAAVRVFTDPATEIETATDLADYLLPGMSGAGVDCATAALDPDPVLSLAIAESAYVVSNLVVSCIEQPGIGELVAMYAVGFEADAAELYPDLAACAADAFDAASTQDISNYLRDIYTARLDLAGPATSPGIAAGILADEFGCAATTEAPTTDDQSPNAETSALPEATGSGERTVKWTMLQAGDCMVALPADNENDVQLADCAIPHEAEVIGRTLAITGTEESLCLDIFETYVGESFDTATWLDMTYYTSTDSFQDPVLICLVHSADDSLLTGSVKAA